MCLVALPLVLCESRAGQAALSPYRSPTKHRRKNRQPLEPAGIWFINYVCLDEAICWARS